MHIDRRLIHLRNRAVVDLEHEVRRFLFSRLGVVHLEWSNLRPIEEALLAEVTVLVQLGTQELGILVIVPVVEVNERGLHWRLGWDIVAADKVDTADLAEAELILDEVLEAGLIHILEIAILHANAESSRKNRNVKARPVIGIKLKLWRRGRHARTNGDQMDGEVRHGLAIIPAHGEPGVLAKVKIDALVKVELGVAADIDTYVRHVGNVDVLAGHEQAMDIGRRVPAVHLDDGGEEHGAVMRDVAGDLDSADLAEEEIFLDQVDDTLLRAVLTGKRSNTKTNERIH